MHLHYRQDPKNVLAEIGTLIRLRGIRGKLKQLYF